MTFDTFFAYLLTFMAGIFATILLNLDVYPSRGEWQGYVMISLLTVLMLFLSAWIHILYINHRKHSKNLTITFDTASKTVRLEKEGQEYVLHEDKIKEWKFTVTRVRELYFNTSSYACRDITFYFLESPKAHAPYLNISGKF